MPVALLNYLDRQMLASMKFSVMQDIPSVLTDENWGFMLGQFKWVYAVFSLIGGYLADRLNRRDVIVGSLFVWSIVTWLTGQVTTYEQLLWVRSMMGVSEAFYIPAALALITDYHLGETRSRAVGLHQIAIYAGVIFGGFAGYVADSPMLGWRFAFEACGAFGVFYAVPLYFILRDVRHTERRPTPSGGSARASLHELLTNVSFILLVLYFTLPALAGWVIRDWMPAILKQQYGLGQGHAGVAAALYLQLAAIVGAAAGGWLADRWILRDHRGRVYVSAIGMTLVVCAIFGVGNAGTLGASIAFLILFGLGWGFFDCNNMPLLSQIVRPQFRATGYGIMNFFSISVGGLADWGFGELNDRRVPLNYIFGVFASAAIVSVILVLLVRPKREIAD